MQKYRVQVLVAISLVYFLLITTLFQNCKGKVRFDADSSQSSFGNPDLTVCTDGKSLCAGSKKIIFINQILVELGDLTLSENLQDPKGFTAVKIYNPYSGRSGYIKVRINDAEVEIARDETKTSYDHMCLDHSKGPCDQVAVGADLITNCASSIHAYDGNQVVTLRSDKNLPQRPACGDLTSMNFEVLQSSGKAAIYPDLEALYQHCHCQMTGTVLARVSALLRQNLTTSTWLRTAFSDELCRANTGGEFTCELR